MDGWMRRRLPRASHCLLLVVLALGIAGMHTLGHARHGSAHKGAPAASTGADPVSAGPAATGASPTGADPVSTRAPGTGGGRPEDRDTTVATARVPGVGGGLPDLDPASVCLAVLTGFLIPLTAVASALVRRRPPHASATIAAPASRVTRPPPRRTASRLACLSVLRI
ncbi:hypothetical protein GCM10017600_23270 [Streptosporangium carneum]|uniref:Uncharacterized protein n=2 Tax=Streptosporangium carneum TaxID=47481 RepID=A0A9W6MCD5_9ACTN|nr:hypothetical protein GCM10017600_23270 [Streptosporangium carneum]